ncbi:MAG: redoxin domain-containing protein [Pseudomonadota bacterium]
MSAARNIAMVGALALTACGMAAAGVEIGAPAPDFTLESSDAATVSLADYRGQYVVLEWTNHDCPYVRKHYESGNMQALQREATEQGITWLTIISSAPGKQGHVDAAQANSLTASRDAAPDAVLFDSNGDVGNAYAAKTTPHMYIVDPQGRLIYQGGIDDKPTSRKADIETATNYVRKALGEALAGEQVVNAVTRPYGCSVKYKS